MNFFDAQDQSRRVTRRLVVLYVLATVLIVAAVTAVVAVAFGRAGPPLTGGDWSQWLAANAALLGGTAAGTAGFIGLATTYKVARLSAGGSRVALDLGATEVSGDTNDPLRRRLRNVVDEMAIASGIPAPRLFVLEQEPGINAFAAGFSPDDAAIAVTRGALETLTRDELQGVVAHEFSHVLNGDMRLNIRLMGVLFGILAIGIIGRLMLRHVRTGRYRSGNDRGGSALFAVLGLGLVVVGWIGVLVARLLKAGVSRQREFLADASAVQFTRQTDGIAGALKKIAGLSVGSAFRAADAEEISHMLFARGGRTLAGLFATHPPLDERIRRLDPAHRAGDASPPPPLQAAGDPRLAGLAAGRAEAHVPVEPRDWLDQAGRASDAHVRWARHTRRTLPELLASAAHSHDQSVLLALALALDDDEPERDRQLHRLTNRLGALRARRVRELYEEYRELGVALRMPLLDLALPALRNRPRAQMEFICDLVDELIAVDGHLSLADYTYGRLLSALLADAASGNEAPSGKARLAQSALYRRSAAALLFEFARAGHDSADLAKQAFAAGMQAIGLAPDEYRDATTTGDWRRRLDRSLESLNRLNAANKRRLLEALVAVARHDAGIRTREAELLRAIAAVLRCPLPPLLPKPADGAS